MSMSTIKTPKEARRPPPPTLDRHLNIGSLVGEERYCLNVSSRGRWSALLSYTVTGISLDRFAI